MRLQMIVAVAVLFRAEGAVASDWYVDGLNGNDGNLGTHAAPFRTSWKGIAVAEPGDTVHLLPTATYPQFGVLDKAGTAGEPITIIGDGVAPNLTKVRGDGSNFAINVGQGRLKIPPSYVTIANLDVQAPGPWVGVFVGARGNHITITHNRIHDSGRAGVNTYHADYITISHNIVFGNSKDTSSGIFGSGISTYENTDIDSNTDVKMIIDSNIIYNNTNTPRHFGESCSTQILSGCNVYWSDSDGSGIIIDDLRHTQSDNRPYSGQTLIKNNVVYGNGGRGVYVNPSDHVIIVNNTLFENNQDPYESSWRPGEIMVDSGGDTKIYNNIIYSDGSGCLRKGAGCNVSISIESSRGLPVTSDYNIIFNKSDNHKLAYYLGTDFGHNNINIVTVGTHDLWHDPLFVQIYAHDFHLRRSSIAFRSAYPGFAPPIDINGNGRSSSGWIQAGAYQQ